LSKFAKKSSELAKINAGFTIVELLIVVVVIAILAAITVVSYNGITKRATEATMQHDLQTAVQLIEIESTETGSYPGSAAGLNGGKGLVGSGDNQITYVSLAGGYCVSVANPKTSTQLKASSLSGQIVPGTCVITNGGVVSTYVGSGTAGSMDGNGTSAQLTSTYGIAIDSAGNLYISNTAIRKITVGGDVAVLSGSMISQGNANGPSATARFYGPKGMAVDSAGYVYVGEAGNSLIRKIAPDGTASTLAGSYPEGYADGNGTAAKFNAANGVAVSSAGVVYVADTNNNRIRKIMPNGDVTPFAGSGVAGSLNGNGTTAQFNKPEGIAIDAAGALYVADTVNNRIRKIMPNGDVTTLAGSGTIGSADNSTGALAQFNRPLGITVDSIGNVYVADTSNNLIRKITPAGAVSTLAGSTTAGFVNDTGSAARFNGPTALVVDASGVLYVADNANYRIRKIQ
jgi:prepilin-type N-terminal cleavage/methylation domain